MAGDLSASQRLYGMMQFLMAHYAEAEEPTPANPRSVVELQDALDALLQVAFVIDEHIQAGQISPGRGVHAAAMLMLVRDYLQPLPEGVAEDGGRDLVAPDLQELVDALRQVRAPDTVPPELG